MNSISLIIPTYNRIEFLDKILKKVLANKFHALQEIIIVDSKSKDGTHELLNNYKKDSSILIHYENTINSISSKRNKGIEIANSDILIFIDDDCVPQDNFFEHHYDACIKNEYQINCGNIFFSKKDIINSNFIKYRNSRHIPFLNYDNNPKILDFQHIVTMNMSLRKKDLLSKKIYFDESFIGYGMEDNYFGLQAQKAGFKIVTNQAGICHFDYKGIDLHALKLYHTARGGVTQFIKLDKDKVWDLNYSYYLEKDYPHKYYFIKFLMKVVRLLLNFKISYLLLNILKITDKYSFLYFKVIYRYVCAAYYLKGIRDRVVESSNKDKLKDWYAEKPNN